MPYEAGDAKTASTQILPLENPGNYIHFYPPTAFDGLLYCYNIPLLDFTNRLQKISTSNDNSEFTSWQQRAQKALYSAATNPLLVARVPLGDFYIYDLGPITLPDQQSMNIWNNDKDEFLMDVEFGKPGYSLLNELKKLRMHKIYGPKTTQVLEAIGYRMKRSDLISSFTLVKHLRESDNTSPSTSGTSTTSIFESSNTMATMSSQPTLALPESPTKKPRLF